MERQELFGSRVRSVREAAGLNRDTVAERMNRSSSYVGEIERGEKWPAFDTLELLAKALEVEPPTLFEYEAEEINNDILLSKLQQLLSNRNTEELQLALRVLRALFRR